MNLRICLSAHNNGRRGRLALPTGRAMVADGRSPRKRGNPLGKPFSEGFSYLQKLVIVPKRNYSESAASFVSAAVSMTTLLTGISLGLGALVVLLLALLVVRWRSDTRTDERVAEVVAGLNERMDELGRELAAALARAEQESRRSRIFGELAGSIDLDEVLARTLEAAGGLEGADAALVMLPEAQGGKPLVATLGLSIEEAERHAITGPPDGRLARSITMSYTYPELDRDGAEGEDEGIIHAGLAVPLPGQTSTLGYLTVFTRTEGHQYSDDDVRQLETLALRAGPAIENARRFREARQLADLDALTGLHNRRYFHETLAREVARAHRYGRRLALIVFDLDDFKAIYHRLLGAVSSHPVGQAGRLSISAGMAELREEDNPTAFFERADEALYRAKERGKGQVVSHEAPLETAEPPEEPLQNAGS